MFKKIITEIIKGNRHYVYLQERVYMTSATLWITALLLYVVVVIQNILKNYE